MIYTLPRVNNYNVNKNALWVFFAVCVFLCVHVPSYTQSTRDGLLLATRWNIPSRSRRRFCGVMHSKTTVAMVPFLYFISQRDIPVHGPRAVQSILRNMYYCAPVRDQLVRLANHLLIVSIITNHNIYPSATCYVDRRMIQHSLHSEGCCCIIQKC